MTKACIALAFFCLAWAMPVRAFNWQTETARGRDYVTLQSFCAFYNFGYANPEGNSVAELRNPQHIVRFQMGRPDMWMDGVHYLMSFPIEMGDHDWLVSRMDVIKLFEPVLRPQEIAGRHTIRGIVIDPGHGGADNGATSRLGAEKNYTLDTAFRLEAILRNAGLKTVLTRRNDVFVDLYERAHIASLYPDYAFVSIHYNSADPEARGLETYCLSPRGAASTSSSYLTRSDIQMLPGNDDDALNILLASAVHSEIIRLNPGDPSMDRGVKRARFVVIKANLIPAILVEGGFVSNRMESARVNSPAYRQELAEAIARGLVKFTNIMGNRHLALPPSSGDVSAPRAQAVAVPVAPTAPSGLERESRHAQHAPATVIAEDGVKAHVAGDDHATEKNRVAAKIESKKSVAHASDAKSKKKGKKLAETLAHSHKKSTTAPGSSLHPALIPPTASQTVSAPPPAQESPKGQALGLSDGAVPTPTPGSEKTAPEPDEPPTVNGSESTKSGDGSRSTNAPASPEP
jgi:N-acetylmuramoyl-L-alanine amidase